MARDPESGQRFQVPQRLVEAAGIHLHGAATPLALEVVVVVPRFTADEPHHLVGTEDAFRPALLNEAFKVAIDRGKPRPPLGHALPDLLDRERPV